MKKVFKSVTIILACLLVLSSVLAGCGSNNSQGAATTPAGNQGSTEPKATEGSGKIDKIAYAMSLATPLSAEDAEIYKTLTDKSNNPDKVVIRYGITVRSIDEQAPTRADRQFMIEMKKRLGDKVEFQIYPGGTLGTTADQILGGLQNGNFEMFGWNLGAMAEYTKAFMPMDIFFLVPDLATADKILSGEPGEIMRQRYIEDTGLDVLHYVHWGMRHIAVSNKEILVPGDLKGLKLRVQNNPVYMKQINAMGASATPISYSEVYTSLQQGVVDGQEQHISGMFDMNFDDVQKYMSISNHMMTGGACIVNHEWLMGQSDEFKQAVKESSAIAQKYAYTELEKVEDGILDYLKTKMDITVLSDEQLAQFKAATETVKDECVKTMGEEYYKKVEDAVKRTLGTP